MQKYNTVTEYIESAQIGDRIVLCRHRHINGIISLGNKYDTYKVVYLDKSKNKIGFAAYGCRKWFIVEEYNQGIVVLTKREFCELPV